MTNYSALAKAEDEAVEWAILLADDPDSIDQRKRFQVWLDADSLHAEVWARTGHVYKGLGQLPPLTQLQWPRAIPHQLAKDISAGKSAVLAKGRVRLPGKAGVQLSHWKKTFVGFAVAASFILAIAPNVLLKFSADYISHTGEQQTHLLQDGSKLYLAPKSAVDIVYSDSKRLVRLLRGSAFFEVQPNPARPFYVDAGGTTTRVLGTSFSVRKSNEGVVVGVAHGHVRVEDSSILPVVAENLTAGEQLSVTWEKGINLARVLPEDVARWRRGELVVRNLPVNDVVAEFRDYYDGVILVRGSFAKQRVTGFYRLDDPIATLTEMARAHGANAHQITPWLLVISQ